MNLRVNTVNVNGNSFYSAFGSQGANAGKYSTEYNNSLFIQMMCQKFGMDKKDLFAFFLNVFSNNGGANGDKQMEDIIEEFEITKLDIQRMQRYLDKCTYPSEVTQDDEPDEDIGWD